MHERHCVTIVIEKVHKQEFIKKNSCRNQKDVGMVVMNLPAKKVHTQGMKVLLVLADKVHKQESNHNVNGICFTQPSLQK